MRIQYLYTEGEREYKNVSIPVKLDGKISGEIRFTGEGWQYFPKGQKTGGEIFKTITLCQKSLSED